MKLERISSNKIKYSITFEELSERGIMENDLDSPIWNHLFEEMLELADQAYHVGESDMLTIEIYSFNVQELVFILTVGEADDADPGEWADPENLEQEEAYFFPSIEEMIALAGFLNQIGRISACSLYIFEDQYYLLQKPETQNASLILEYGERAQISPFMVREYGIAVFEQNALAELLKHFP
ncbi:MULTISPECIES: adaptor protein MecA [Heyndrickxia]|jgi:adapter protein MecA 1/2|uniref:Uncharacterized protein n=1 Tax=Heyndrickxia coagulans TaxID=1398 RepID=A0A150JU79_HEYCO|nr:MULTISPECIES: adaptor protein MecA [Heyndrickxia]AEH53636.1 Negative regulator of genetic competence [Heyndrickxia coagulans 2-6]KYC60865.1 hypothetical protein B4098_3109 [Heyndrickxia coagulans]MED4311518.1 adaptor protein MecA [Heyndrickxia coagulans]